jgi:hypothetical protein
MAQLGSPFSCSESFWYSADHFVVLNEPARMTSRYARSAAALGRKRRAKGPLNYLDPAYYRSAIESLPAFSAALAIPDLAALIFSAYCSGMRVDFQCRDVLHTWGYRATRRHAVERLVGAQRHAAVSTKSNGPRGALESWVPFSEQLVESSIEDGAANL